MIIQPFNEIINRSMYYLTDYVNILDFSVNKKRSVHQKSKERADYEVLHCTDWQNKCAHRNNHMHGCGL